MGTDSNRADLFGVFFDALGWDGAIDTVIDWSYSDRGRYICICNVHSLVLALESPEHRDVVSRADLVTPDGAPIAWVMRWLYGVAQPRINGPDLMWRVCEKLQGSDRRIFLLGGSERVLSSLVGVLSDSFPRLCIAGVYSPPYMERFSSEDVDLMAKKINASGAAVVWVGLGCPKQEHLAFLLANKVNAVFIGVGAAFDYHAGSLKRAPVWMQHAGLEWFYRLMSEPRRLWRRYLYTNCKFIKLVFCLLCKRVSAYFRRVPYV